VGTPVALTGAGNLTTTTSVSSSSATVTKPSNLADGDLMIAVIYFQTAGGTVTVPSGWTLLASWSIRTGGIYAKAVPTASAESGNPSYVWSSSAGVGRMTGTIFRVTGAALTGASLPEAAGTAAGATGTSSVVLPTVTATSTTPLLIAAAFTNTTGTGLPAFSPPTGLNTVTGSELQVPGSSTSTSWVGTETLAGSGATGTRTIGLSPTATNSGGVMVTITGVLNASVTPPVVATTTTVPAPATTTGSTTTPAVVATTTTVPTATAAATDPLSPAAIATTTAFPTARVTVPATTPAVETGSWWSLVSILKEARQYARDDATRIRAACPNCGEPLRSGPRDERYCSFDGYRAHR
jgi:hypothetical protein